MAKALSNKEQAELWKLEMAPVVSSSVRSELSYSSSSESEEEEIEDEEEILMDSCPYTINFLTEFLGTAIQMFIGCLGSIYTFDIGPVITAFSFGLGRLMCYEIFNQISPLHVNPAKSLGFYVLGRMHFLKLVIYMVGQFSGAVVGISIVTAVAPSNVDNICVTAPHRASVGSALVMEFVSTMILMLVVAAATDPVNEKKKDSLSLRMGCVVLGLVLTLDIYTTAGKNPARSLGPALVYNNWKYQWLYKVGPFCGAVIGALLYRFIFDVHHHSLHKFLKHCRQHHRHHHHHEPQTASRIQNQNLQLRTKMEEEIPHRAPGEPPPLVISFLSEFCGTAVLMWVGCMGCLELFGIGPVIPAFAFGLAVTMAIQSFAHISPVHINPAVSTGVLVLGKIRPVTYLVYISAQFLGALVGFALLQVVMPWHDQKLCVLHLGAYMDPVKGFFIEFGATFVLMLVVSSLFDPKNAPFEDSLSLKLGMVIAGLVFSVAPFTGAGLNPARALAPALLYNHWSNSWLYLLAPFCGMIASALISRFVFNAYEKYSLYNFLRRYCKWCAI